MKYEVGLGFIDQNNGPNVDFYIILVEDTRKQRFFDYK